MSLAKLTSLSTQTLSLLLARQRAQTLPSFTSGTISPHVPQIVSNLEQLRTGILALEAKEGRSEAVSLLRNQYERMRVMLGADGNVESLEDTPPASTASTPQPSEPLFKPYTDDPTPVDDDEDPNAMLQTQRLMMNEQDQRLEALSNSITRQHHISIQINDELEVHHGLLEELDTDLDNTGNRLTAARRRLDKVAQGAKDNKSTVAIAAIIFILLILIIYFKT